MLKIYVANLGKYNEGELKGKWLNLPVTDEEIQQLFISIGLAKIVDGEYKFGVEENGVYYEEYAIHDYESDIDGFKVSEYENIDNLNEIAERYEALDEGDQEKVKAALEYDSYYFKNFDELLDKLDDVAIYEAHNDTELGEYIVDEGMFGVEIPEALVNYIDYEAIGRDFSISASGGFTSYGFVEIR